MKKYKNENNQEKKGLIKIKVKENKRKKSKLTK